MAKHKDISGQRFGRLIAIRFVGSSGVAQHARWLCVCDCGQEFSAAGAYLRRGHITSCGCAQKETQFKAIKLDVYGASKTRTYAIWAGMLSRCSDQSTGKSRRLYFLRGIRVCERWQSFGAFLEDMGEAPDGLSIDRVHGGGNYEPGNCRWATALEQANNTRANRLIVHNGKSMTISQWARHLGIKPNTLTYRLRRGVHPDLALNETLARVYR